MKKPKYKYRCHQRDCDRIAAFRFVWVDKKLSMDLCAVHIEEISKMFERMKRRFRILKLSKPDLNINPRRGIQIILTENELTVLVSLHAYAEDDDLSPSQKRYYMDDIVRKMPRTVEKLVEKKLLIMPGNKILITNLGVLVISQFEKDLHEGILVEDSDDWD